MVNCGPSDIDATTPVSFPVSVPVVWVDNKLDGISVCSGWVSSSNVGSPGASEVGGKVTVGLGTYGKTIVPDVVFDILSDVEVSEVGKVLVGRIVVVVLVVVVVVGSVVFVGLVVIVVVGNVHDVLGVDIIVGDVVVVVVVVVGKVFVWE
jgi:hypothetical protein